MTDLKQEDVMRALECCTNKQRCDCDNCPYVNRYHCTNVVLQDALALLREKDKEIERLQADAIQHELDMHYSVCREENAMQRGYEKAVSEFAERLCEGRVSNDPVVIAARVAAKELKGEKE